VVLPVLSSPSCINNDALLFPYPTTVALDLVYRGLHVGQSGQKCPSSWVEAPGSLGNVYVIVVVGLRSRWSWCRMMGFVAKK
jgi:hypothetical protein